MFLELFRAGEGRWWRLLDKLLLLMHRVYKNEGNTSQRRGIFNRELYT